MDDLFTEYQEHFELDSLEQRVQIPYVLKNRLLISPGVHNGFKYSSDSLNKIYRNTQWNRHNTSLFWDHIDQSKGGGASTWIGEVKNIHNKDGNVYGDLWIINKQAAMNLEYGAKLGISAKVEGASDRLSKEIVDGIFANWSLVFSPADKRTYLNQEQEWVTFLNFEEKKMADIEEKNEGDAKPEVQLSDVLDAVSKLSEKVEVLEKKKKEEYPEPEDEMQKKKYPEPKKKEEEEMSDDEKKPEAEKKPEEEKPAEGDKPAEKPAEGEEPAEASAELSDEELDEIFENASYREFVKDYMKKNKGASIADAAKAWKKQGEKKEMSELKKQVEELQLKIAPERKTVKESTDTEDIVATLSDAEADRAFATYVLEKGRF